MTAKELETYVQSLTATQVQEHLVRALADLVFNVDEEMTVEELRAYISKDALESYGHLQDDEEGPQD